MDEARVTGDTPCGIIAFEVQSGTVPAVVETPQEATPLYDFTNIDDISDVRLFRGITVVSSCML